MKKRTQREERQKRQGLPYGLLILAMLIFGTNGLLVSRISVQSSQIVLLRTLIGGALLSVIVLLRGGFDRNAVRADLPMLLLGGTALGLNWVALFGAYRLLNVSLATLIYYIGPILVLLFSALLFREKLTAVKMAAVIVVAVGLVCISGSILSGGMNLTGLLTAVASALFYAALIVFNKRITHTQGLQTAAIELDIAFAIVLVYCLLTVGLPHPLRSDLPYIAVIGTVNTGLAYLLYFSGLQKLSGQSVALISYVDPVSALLFSALFLRESLTPVQMIGAVLIIGGAMLGELKKRGPVR